MEGIVSGIFFKIATDLYLKYHKIISSLNPDHIGTFGYQM